MAAWSNDAYGARRLHVGDRFQLADLVARNYLLTHSPAAGEPLRILEAGLRCESESVFSEVSVEDGCVIADMKLVICDVATVGRVHFLPPPGASLWDWAGGLADPGEWNETVLWTADRLRRLLNKLMVRGVIHARSLQEAELFIDLIGCRRESPFTLTDGLWRAECVLEYEPERRIELAFSVEDPNRGDDVVAAFPGGPSQILPADVFRRKSDEHAAKIPSYPSDLHEAPTRFAEAKDALRKAAVYLEQLSTYIPTGEELVPLDAFWGDEPRAEREAWPERYARSRIEATLARWRAELEVFGEPVVLDARSAEEAYVFMAIHPCPRCGTETPRLHSRLEASGVDLISVYTGECPICALPRRFAFRLPEMPVFQSGDAIELGPDRSTCLDPGQLLLAADQFAQEAGDDVDDAALQRLKLAIACLDEILKWVPESGQVPEEAITSRVGWAIYEQEPGRFEASRLRAVRDTYRGIVDTALASE